MLQLILLYLCILFGRNLSRMGDDPELGLGGRLLEWWSFGAFIVSAVDHSYLVTLLLLWPTMSSYSSTTLVVPAVRRAFAELGNLNGVRVNSTEQEPGNCDVARVDPTEQELGNCNVARVDPTEQELGNCDVARVDPTEQELGN
ncbi:hypothetical protein BHE74_00001769, partial [Ensete ventricosum]